MTQHARLAYDAFAPIYDDFNAQNDYEAWFSVLLPKLDRLGLRTERGGRLLDVACGTGRAFEPMTKRGWEILGCDISPEMIDVAKKKFWGIGFELDVADMRHLPIYRPGAGYHLVWALNDPVNYLLEDGDLEAAFTSMGRNLADDGLLVFDANTIAHLCASFDPQGGLRRDERWEWRPLGETNGIWEAEISGERVVTHLHRERHHPVASVHRALQNAGLEIVATLGHREDEKGLLIEDDWDEERDLKIIHVARRPG